MALCTTTNEKNLRAISKQWMHNSKVLDVLDTTSVKGCIYNRILQPLLPWTGQKLYLHIFNGVRQLGSFNLLYIYICKTSVH